MRGQAIADSMSQENVLGRLRLLMRGGVFKSSASGGEACALLTLSGGVTCCSEEDMAGS